MELAQRPGLKNDRRLLRAFGGLNEGYACTEAEYAAGENFSARDFPALSTRPPRCRLRTLRDVNGLYCRSGLLAVCGRDLHYIPEQGEEVTLPQALTDGPKTLVGLGAKVLRQRQNGLFFLCGNYASDDEELQSVLRNKLLHHEGKQMVFYIKKKEQLLEELKLVHMSHKDLYGNLQEAAWDIMHSAR